MKKKQIVESVHTINSKGDLGNTHSPNPAKTLVSKQPNGRIHHFFTLNNYDSNDILILNKLFNEYCYMYCFQEETGESKTPHLQGVVSCKKPTRDSAFCNKKIHWERVICAKAAYVYCSDPSKRTGGIWTKNYQREYSYIFKHTYYVWQSETLKLLAEKPNDRSVIWIWSSQGSTGKSSFCKHLVSDYNATFLSKGRFGDIVNIIYKSDMDSSRIVLIDIPRNNGNNLSYNAIEAIKNGMISNTKYETGFKTFEPPHVCVFSNEPPDLSKLSEDRWIVINID